METGVRVLILGSAFFSLIIIIALSFAFFNKGSGPQEGVAFSPGDNLIRNGGFDSSDNWILYGRMPNGSSVIEAGELKITGYGFAMQKFPSFNNAVGKKFVLSFRAVNNGAQAGVYIQEVPSLNFTAQLFPNSSSWTDYSLNFSFPNDEEYAIFIATLPSDREQNTSVAYDDFLISILE